MDGTFETPFENDNLHTYWADGTFSFARDKLASGYVCNYFEWGANENHVGDRMQYNDFESVEGWPEWAREVYRPGVSILRLPGEQAVLVAQRMHGLYPPKEYPQLEQKDVVPLGESVYLDQDGNVLESGNHDESARYTMISHIPNRPLKSLMPPDEIVEKNRALVARMTPAERQGMYTMEEKRLHVILDGNMDDFEAIQDNNMWMP
jgi:hypothetical protein